MRTNFRLAVPIVVVMSVLIGCSAAQKPQRTGDEWAFDGKAHDLDGDPDAAENRWRKEIAAQGWSDEQDMLDRDKLLTDDPPGAPSSYGKVSSGNDPSSSSDGADPAVPKTFWGRVQSGADTVGKASFAALTVLVTLGMMVAPYLLL